MKFFLFATAFCVAHAALFIYKPDPNYPNSCYSQLTGEMQYDEEKYFEICKKAICYDDGRIRVETCSPVKRGCRTTIKDIPKPYPECCPQQKNCDNVTSRVL